MPPPLPKKLIFSKNIGTISEMMIFKNQDDDILTQEHLNMLRKKKKNTQNENIGLQ